MKPLSNNQQGAAATISFRLDGENAKKIYGILDETPKDVTISTLLRAFVASGLEQFELGKGHPDIVRIRKSQDDYMVTQAEKLGAIPKDEAEAMRRRIEELEKQLAKKKRPASRR